MEIATQADLNYQTELRQSIVQAKYNPTGQNKLAAILLTAAQVSIFAQDVVEAREWERRLRIQLLKQQQVEAEHFLAITRAPVLTIYIQEVAIPLLEIMAQMSSQFTKNLYTAKHIRLRLGNS
jgi:hypothetical protein